MELPKFEGSIADITADTPFIDKLVRVLKEMPECRDIPENIEDDILVSIFEAADTQCYNKNDMKDYISSVMSEYEYNANLNEAKDEGRAEGLAEGEAKGRTKGLAEGEAKGKAEGLAEGKAEAAMEIARAMKDKGMDIALIVSLTSLDEKTVSAL